MNLIYPINSAFVSVRLRDTDSDGKNLLENRKQLGGYSANVMEVATWKMNVKKNNAARLCATNLLFNKYSVV